MKLASLTLALPVCAALLLACEGDVPPPATGAPADATTPQASAAAPAAFRLDSLDVPRFRPAFFEDSNRLWGIQGGRLALLHLPDGRLEVLPHTAWSVSGAPGVVGWRNEQGTWAKRTAAEPRLLAPADARPGFDGPADALWSPDGGSALLSWGAEWDAAHELVDGSGERRPVRTDIEGYFLDAAALWLDARRVLFTTVANAPIGGAPEYRESGWRGDLAVLDVQSGEYRRVSDVADGTFLRPAGSFRGGVLVLEHDSTGVRRLLHWRGDGTLTPLPMRGTRVFAAADLAIALDPERRPQDDHERWRARLLAPDTALELGSAVDADLGPALTRDGQRAALRLERAGRTRLFILHR